MHDFNEPFQPWGRWWRFKYHITEVNSIPVISTIPNAQVRRGWSLYHPFIEGHSPEVQPKEGDEHKSTPHSHLARVDLSNTSEILEFVNAWGLLGLWGINEFRMWPFPEVATPDIGAYTYEKMNTPKGDITIGLGDDFSLWYLADSNSYPDEAIYFIDPRRFREPLGLFVHAAEQYQKLCSVIASDDTGPRPFFDDEGHIITNLAEECTPIFNRDGGHWQMAWFCPSLLHTIYLRTMLDTTQTRGFRRCSRQNCRKFFTPSSTDSEYCSSTCRRAQVQADYRVRKKIHSLASKGKSPQQIAEALAVETVFVFETLGMKKGES